jgi:hypothetical protein
VLLLPATNQALLASIAFRKNAAPWNFLMIQTIVLIVQGIDLFIVTQNLVNSDSHGIKRGGNNHFGSTGILKCLTCRKRKGKVRPFSQEHTDSSVNIMIMPKRADSAPIDHYSAGLNCLPRALGPTNYHNSSYCSNGRQEWSLFLIRVNYLQLRKNSSGDFPLQRSERSMPCQNSQLKALLQWLQAKAHEMTVCRSPIAKS